MPKTIAKETLLALLGGRWPEGFSWLQVDEFRLIAPITIQGFVGDDPVGPAFEFRIRMITDEEALRRMQDYEMPVVV